MTDRIRTTISLPQDVHEVFKQMADASGMSVSRCMGDWLSDTADGARHVAMQLQQAKEATKAGIRELHSSLIGGEGMDKFTTSVPAPEDARSAATSAAPRARKVPGTPYSNTGLKSPSGGKTGGGKA